jgi:hypothetical protein
MSRPRFLFALVAGAALAGSDYAVGAVIYQTVAISGQHAPGTAAGVTYSNFDTPSLNNTGQAIFSGHLTTSAGVTASTDDVVYAGPFASPQLVARAGDPAPGMPAGVNYSLFNNGFVFIGATLINDAGQIAFLTQLTGSGVTTSNDDAFYGGTVGSPQLLARAADPAPGTPAGVAYRDFQLVHLNENGQVSVFAVLTGGGVTSANSTAIYAGAVGSLQLAARNGNPAPGTTGSYTLLGLEEFNDAGQVAFGSSVSGANNGIFAGAAGSVQLVARQGGPAHDAPPGVSYAGQAAPDLSNAGVAYRAFWNTGVGGVNSTNDEVLYAGPITSPTLLAREGNAAPGTPAGVNYSSFRNPALNDAGHVAFFSVLTGPGVTTANDEAVFAGLRATPQLIAREGDPAPGTTAGVVFSSMPNVVQVGHIAPNVAGQIALPMMLTGSGVTTANDGALFLFDPGLGAMLIAREGNLFDIGGGVFRTIADNGISFAAAPGLREDQSVNGLSNDGTLVFRLTFTNGTSGIFTAAVPEPAALSLLALGATMFLLRHRRTC